MTKPALAEPRRILMIAPTPFFADRGCHVQIAEEIWALQRQGYEVRLVTYGLGRDVPYIKTDRIGFFPWYTKLEAGPTLHKFYLDPLLAFKAYAVAREFKPDVIHGHLHEGCVIGWLVQQFYRAPLLFDLQGSLTGELLSYKFSLAKAKWLQDLWYGFERWIDQRADMVVTQSTDMRNELINLFKVGADRVVLTYDGVNTNTFIPQEPDKALQRQLGIPENAKVIVYLGGLAEHQGTDDLVAAWPAVIKEVPDAFLLLMGYPNEDKYRARVKELGVEKSVLVTGKIPYDEAPRYLALGNIAVSPKRSATEANGKIYNYMACGLPTVAFDTVVNHDILGDLGVYVKEIGDVTGLANTMARLLKSPDEIERLSQQVRSKAVADYSWDAVATRMTKAYRLAQRHYFA
ncbi:MAG: glycosyltransferase family 4 protein [Candidatus Andersenbacteria bacterium]|nr:glycosyltransferase family 4 protein [Candidatus Andersenbacteria bacterium]MBI3250251.1 glycosyltransferase family 4 protein [Candidatus Andersenbacteria bacterium]